MTERLRAAWEDALPSVLALMADPQRGMFRRELQRFLATSRFDPAGAAALAGPLGDLLLQAARAARHPAAISALREPGPTDLESLCEHILACWRDAEGAVEAGPGGAPDDSGIFFGPRLGGPGREGAVRRRAPEED